MEAKVFAFLLTCVLGVSAAQETNVGSARDSYVDAFKATHSLNKHDNKVERDSSYFPEQQGYPHPIYKPQDEYGPPKDVYGPPKDVYGPPKDGYGPPRDVYGPPQNSYAPPQQAYGPPAYGPPSNHLYGPPGDFHGYGLPSSLLHGILEKFKFKLDLFTIGKIILKVFLFKKIVSFIAVLCLLLFIPSLKPHKDKEEEHDDEEEMRAFKKRSVDERLNNITSFVTQSIDSFKKKHEDFEDVHCDTIYCKSENLLKFINSKVTYKKLLALYVQEKR